MGAMKQLAEEMGLLDKEKTYYLSIRDMRNLINGAFISIEDDGSVINLKLEGK